MSENMRCAECGQLVGPATVFHPYLYCLLYKKLHVTDQEAFLRSYGFVRESTSELSEVPGKASE